MECRGERDGRPCADSDAPAKEVQLADAVGDGRADQGSLPRGHHGPAVPSDCWIRRHAAAVLGCRARGAKAAVALARVCRQPQRPGPVQLLEAGLRSRRAPVLPGDPDIEQKIAAFLLGRGPFAYMGYSWEGCADAEDSPCPSLAVLVPALLRLPSQPLCA